MTDLTALHAALEAYKPELAARFDAFIRWQFDAMVKDCGPSLKNIDRDGRWVRVWYNTMSPLVTRTDDRFRPLEAAFIREDRLANEAAKYAENVVESWKVKIDAKLGELESAQVKNMGGMQFNITGTKHDRQVRIEQTVIVKTSSLGKVFNQFPARIYVDGKFTSEAAFKRLAA